MHEVNKNSFKNANVLDRKYFQIIICFKQQVHDVSCEKQRAWNNPYFLHIQFYFYFFKIWLKIAIVYLDKSEIKC